MMKITLKISRKDMKRVAREITGLGRAVIATVQQEARPAASPTSVIEIIKVARSAGMSDAEILEVCVAIMGMLSSPPESGADHREDSAGEGDAPSAE